jgi:hypothetical protein
MNRAAVIEQLKQTQDTLARLLALLEAGEADRFAAHLYPSRRQYRRTSERPDKGNKAIEREVLSSDQIAQALGLTAIIASGNTCCGFTSDGHSPSTQIERESDVLSLGFCVGFGTFVGWTFLSPLQSLWNSQTKKKPV